VSREEFLRVFAGFFGGNGVWLWLFCGQDVVNCVASVETERRLNRPRIFCTDFGFIFAQRKAAAEAAAVLVLVLLVRRGV
jgi:hypothetical protein